MPAGINLGNVSTKEETRYINCTSKMHENTCGRLTFFINLMFSRLDKFDGIYIQGNRGGLIFGILIGLHIWGGVYSGGVLTGFYGISISLTKKSLQGLKQHF